MSAESTSPSGPDLTQGIAVAELADGSLLAGHVGDKPVLLARRGDEVFAIGSLCTHYGAPLKDGLLVGHTVRCPWHHASFCLRTGDALRAPALNPVARWRVERRDGTVYVREKLERLARQPAPAAPDMPASVVIVGGGAAGNAAAEMLRREGYAGRLTMLSADESVPCDRPNLSKGFLAGTAPASSNPLRSPDFYREHGIDLQLKARVAAIETGARSVQLADGSRHSYDALLLATGAEPVRLDVPGAELAHVHYLRTWADSQALVDKALISRRAVVIGASFIGLEVAASLRQRGLEIAVVAPDDIPMGRVLGPAVGGFIRRLHEAHGVAFHLGTTATAIDERGVTPATGVRLDADLVVIGIGVRPAVTLAEQAGIATDQGVTVDAFLETSVSGIFAAGDIARWPDRLTGESIRVEHWVVAERQGQTAARNMIGRRERFDQVPFFWTEQYDFGLGYTGHAERWDKAEIDGDLDGRNCTIAYSRDGEKLALAVIHRDRDGLLAEVEFERRMQNAAEVYASRKIRNQSR
jgi:NADPH-dependent 2,4-dienoyl-CoA reductase/sulfur reductase-like enzyme/nitrite reductase/ring-hydroxylating ferredoxin subunit